VVLVRVLIEIGVVAPGFLPVAAPPLAVLLLLSGALGAAVWFRRADHAEEAAPPGNPSELRPALVFGLLYALVLLAVAAAEDRLGEGGLYAVAALSGLTDLDAITLSTSQLVAAERLDAATGWRLIVVAYLANLAFKGAVVALLGHRRLLSRIALLFAAAMAAGGLLLALWPA
jgi:uncharacterized membrane protein (DUF4010 family)